MAYYFSPIGNTQIIDSNGDPLVGGTISTFLAGTSTPSTTYTDDTGGTSQGVVMTLNSLGLPTNGPVWMLGGVPLKFIIKNASGVTQSTFDDISGIGDTASVTDEWLLYGAAPTYISATSFSVVGDQTNILQIGRRLKSINTGGTVYSTITDSSFSADVTTVTVVNTSGVLDSGLSAVSYGVLSAINPTVPAALSGITSINGGQLAGFKNAVVNGAGLVQFITAPTLTAALQYGAAEGHQIGVTGGTSVSGTVGVLSNSGFSCGVGYGAIAASWTTGQFIHKHRIEGANTKRFNSKTVTVSGNIYQDTGGTRNFTISLGKPTTTLDTFSAVTTLGTSSAAAVPTGVVTPFSYTLALGAADAALGLEITITDNAANTVSSKNYAISDLQLEIGSVASVFEHLDIEAETARCQRYFEQIDARHFNYEMYSASGGLSAHVNQVFKVTKRTNTPAITQATPASQGASSALAVAGTSSGIEFTWTAGAGVAFVLFTAGTFFTASARL